MKIQDLLLKFQGVKQVSENQYMAICPAHDDHSPSLSIGLSKDRKQILLNCFAGCKAEDILNNVGLKLKDMYDNDERNETNTMSKTVYTYYNADGSIAYTKNRFDKADGKKSFSFVRPNGEKGLGDKKPVPYNLPEVIVLRRSTSSKEKSVRTRLFRQEELQPRLTAVPGQNGFRNIRITSWVKRSSFFRIMITRNEIREENCGEYSECKNCLSARLAALKAMYTTG